MFVLSPDKSRVTLFVTTAWADITGVSQHLPPVCPQFVQSPVSPRSHPVIPITISYSSCVLVERMLSVGGLWSGEISPIGLSVAALCSQCDLMGLDILLLYYSTLPPLNIYRPNIGGVEDCWTDCPQHWLLDYHPPLNLVRLKEEDIDLAGNNVMI